LKSSPIVGDDLRIPGVSNEPILRDGDAAREERLMTRREMCRG